MKRQDAEQIGDVLRRALETQGLTSKLDETKAVAIWPKIIGQHIAELCSRPWVDKGRMTIYVKNASLKHELNMNRSSLVKLINESLGKEVISEIFFR